MIRHLQPERIIEIGSGNSSCLMLDTNELFFKGSIACSFIEPYPEYFYSLLRPDDIAKINLIPDRLQDLDLAIFEQLEAQDILFIDSTHVSKLNSDVNKYVFEILPCLKKGVVIHIHDVFHPFEYPLEWLREGRSWNEQYVIRAFLQYNNAFSIKLFTTHMIKKHYSWFEEKMPKCLKSTGGSLWLEKTG
jgi:predicted O-methyltransferase YrrM